MVDFKHQEVEIGLKQVRRSFAEHNDFSEGSSEPKEDTQVIRERVAAHKFFKSNYLFSCVSLAKSSRGNALPPWKI